MKLAAVVGAVLIALGAGVAWVALGGDGGDRRTGAIGSNESLEEGARGAIQWRGEFSKEASYQPLDVVSFEGSSYIAKTEVKEIAPPDEPWDLLAQAGAQGAQGAGGAFNGTFTSPNGKYSLTVADTGIVLSGGPNELIKLSNTGIEIETGQTIMVRAGNELRLDSGAATRMRAGGTMSVEASASTTVRGSLLNLNCTSGGKPVARQGDPVQMHPTGGTGPILQGSSTVLAC